MENKLIFGTGSRFGRLTLKKAESLVDFAFKNNIKRFDTGYNYGNFKSQPLLIKALSKYLKKDREEVNFSTKVSPQSFDYIKNCVQETKKQLSDTFIDNLYIWGPNESHLEDKNFLKKLSVLKKQKIIKKLSINTHSLNLINKISTGFYQEIDGIMIDYNLLRQDRELAIENCKKNNLEVIAGTVLCQGLLLESPLKIFFRNRSPFYLGRFIFKKDTRKMLSQTRKFRKYMSDHFDCNKKKVPLSFVLNNPKVDYISIGMMSKKSIKINLAINSAPLNINLTEEIKKVCLSNFQII